MYLLNLRPGKKGNHFHPRIPVENLRVVKSRIKVKGLVVPLSYKTLRNFSETFLTSITCNIRIDGMLKII